MEILEYTHLEFVCRTLQCALDNDYLTVHLFFCGGQIKQTQDGERKQLTQLRDVLKASLQSEQKEVRGRSLRELYFSSTEEEVKSFSLFCLMTVSCVRGDG